MRIWRGPHQAKLSANIRLELLKNFLSSLPQAVGISATTTIGAVVLAHRSGTAADVSMAVAFAMIGFWRVMVLLCYRRRRSTALTLASITPWYRWHSGGLVAQAATLGIQTFNAFTGGDSAAALLALGFVMAFCAGACARLSMVPWVPITTGLLMFVPTIYGALGSSELPINLAGVFLICFVPVFVEATLYLHRLVVDRLLAVQDATHRASHDGLTGLANRTFFHHHLDLACHRQTTSAHQFMVFYLDLDGFKTINDQLGHAAGDLVLVEVADRLRLSTGTGDLVSRLGGDEFAILLEAEPHGSAARDLEDRLTRDIAAPIRLPMGVVTVGVSIGVARSSTHATTASEILVAADQAMYTAKARGKEYRQATPPAFEYSKVA